jgi:hypothetical protein
MLRLILDLRPFALEDDLLHRAFDYLPIIQPIFAEQEEGLLVDVI